MPVIKSSKKRVKQTLVKTRRNARLKKDIRLATQALDNQLAKGKSTEIANAQSKLSSLLDTAGKKKVFHKNKVARRKAQVAKKVKASTTKKSTKGGHKK